MWTHELDFASVNKYFSMVRPVKPGKHFCQSRFTRSIFTHESMHLAGTKLERDVIQHLDAGKRFTDMACLKEPIHTAF